MAMYTTPNYAFCFNVLKPVFYMQIVPFDELYGKEEATRKFILTSILLMQKNFRIPCPPSYLDLPIRFESDGNHKAIILELPDAKSECDCNYVALRKSADGKLLFASGELYVLSRKFMLCVYTQRAHYALSREITSYQDFADGVLALKDDYE